MNIQELSSTADYTHSNKRAIIPTATSERHFLSIFSNDMAIAVICIGLRDGKFIDARFRTLDMVCLRSVRIMCVFVRRDVVNEVAMNTMPS
jgi:hypothetical protein